MSLERPKPQPEIKEVDVLQFLDLQALVDDSEESSEGEDMMGMSNPFV
jgi:hypothetical protein